MFADRVKIFCRAGRGGDGSSSMRREMFVPKGGPDGGDGGRGGSVWLVADASLNEFSHLMHRPHLRAAHGAHGRGRDCFGASAEDLEVLVPVGTIVRDEEGHQLADLVEVGQRFEAAKGGRGGLGNLNFVSATNQAPTECTPGEPGEERELDLELQLIADCGLVGLPNAGKSTFLAQATSADPRIADYPFTTLSPHLGVAALGGDRRLVLADIPGLIEGAADGAGLGHDFLRHVARTRVLIHVVDLDPPGADAAESHRTILGELKAFDAELATRPRILFLNKADLIPEDLRTDMVEELRSALGSEMESTVVLGSSATGEGVRNVLEACWPLLERQSDRGWSVNPE